MPGLMEQQDHPIEPKALQMLLVMGFPTISGGMDQVIILLPLIRVIMDLLHLHLMVME